MTMDDHEILARREREMRAARRAAMIRARSLSPSAYIKDVEITERYNPVPNQIDRTYHITISTDAADDTPAHQETIHFLTSDVMRSFNQSNMADDNYSTSQSNLPAAGAPVAAPHAQRQRSTDRDGQRAPGEGSGRGGQRPTRIADEMSQDLHDLSRDAPLDGGESTFGGYSTLGGSQLVQPAGGAGGEAQSSQQQRTPLLRTPTPGDDASELENNYERTDFRINDDDDDAADQLAAGQHVQATEQQLEQLAPDNVDIQRPLQQAGLITTTIDDDGDDDANERERKALEESSRAQIEAGHLDNALELGTGQPNAQSLNDAQDHSSRSLPVESSLQLNTRTQHSKPFLVSFMVDARGGAMRGCRHSGVRVIIPPNSAPQPMRITCRYLRRERLVHPPPLMEGEACASKIIEVGPAGAKFLGPVLIEVPHFASLRGREREIIILRSDHGEVWREHLVEADENLIDMIVKSAELVELQQQQQQGSLERDGQENRPPSALGGGLGGGGGSSSGGGDSQQQERRLTRIVTNEFPQYFAIISRIRQEVHTVGPEGSIVDSQTVPRVQANFTDGALTKRIKIGLQNEPQEYEPYYLVEQRTRSPSGGRRTVSPSSGGGKRKSRFLSCFGANHERSRGELGFASSSNDESPSSSEGGDSPRQYAVVRPHAQRRPDVSDSEGDSLGTLTRSPPQQQQQHTHRRPRPHSLAACEFVPDDYYIEREPPLILYGERPTYGKRMASSSAQTDSSGYRPHKGKRRGFLVSSRPSRSKTQMQIPYYEPAVIYYPSSQQQQQQRSPRRPKSADPRTSSPGGGGGGYSSLEDVSDDVTSPTSTLDSRQPSKFRTCTIQTDSDSVTVQYVTLAAVPPNNAAAAASATTTTSTDGIRPAGTPFDDGYVSGSGDAKKGFYRHQQHPSGVVQTNGRKTGRHFLPSCISTEDDDTYGDYDLSREDTIIIEEDGRPVRHLSRKPSSRPGSRTTSLSRNTSLSRADSPIPTKTVEKVITTTTTIMGQSFEEPLTSGEEADESLSTSTKQPSSTNVKLTKKQEKLYLKELAKERAKAEKEAKKKHKITPPDDASRPQSPSPVPAAPAVKPSQNVKFAPSPNKDYRQEVPPVSESFTVEQPTVVHNIREIERTLEPPGQVDVEHDDSLVPLSIGEPTLAYEPPTTTAQAPLKPILKQQWSGDYDEPKSISSMADRIVTTVTDQALQEFRPRTPSIEDDLPQTSKEIETLDFHFTDEEPKESKRDREKRRKTKRDEERRLVKEAHKLAKEAERAAKEAQRQAVVAQKESVRAKRIAELSQVERDVLSTTSEFFVKTDEPKVPEMPKVPTITVEQQPKQPEVETIDPQHVDTPPVATLERQPVDETIDLHHIERPPVKPLTVQEPSQVIAVEEQIRPVTPTKRPRIKPKGSRLNCFKVRKPKRSISGSQDSLSRVRQPETEVTQVVIDEHTFEAEQVQEPKEKPRTKSPKGPTASCFSCARKPKTTDPLDDETSPKVEEPGKPSERLEGAKPKRPSTSCFSCARKPKTTDSQEDISQVRPEPETEVTREILDEQTFETGPKVEQPAETIERIEESGKKPEGLDVAKPKRPTTSCFSCARKPKTTDSQEDVSARELHQPETEVTREVLEEQTFPQTEQKSDKPEKLSAKPKKSGTSCLSCARKPKRADSDEDLSRVRQPETEVTREVLEEQTFPQTEQKSDKPEELSARPKKSGTSCFSCARKPKTTDSQEDVSAQELRQPETEVTREVLEEQTFPQTEQKPDKPDKLSAKPKKSGTSCLSCGRKPKRADSDEDLSRVRQPETEVTREVLDEQTFETGPKVEQPAETSTIERIEVPEQKPQKLATLKPKRPSSSCFSCARKPKTTDSQEDVSARERGPETEVTREVLDEQTFETDPKGERETPTIERIEEPAKDPERLDAAKPKRPSSSCFSCAGKVKKTDSLDEGSFPTGETRVEGGKIKARSKELRDQKRKKRSIWSRIFRSRRTEPKQVEVIETTTTSRFDLPVGEQPRESPVPVNQQIVSEMYPRDPDNVDGEMILEVNVPKEFVREPQMPSAPPLQTEQSPMKPPRQQLPEPVVPVDEPQPRVPVDESIDSDRVEQPPVRPLELVPAPEPEQPIEEPRQTPVDETIDSDRVQRPPVAPLAELPSRPREPSIEREPETIEPAPETSRREEPEVTEITTEITREVIDHVENVQTPEDKKERKRREKEEKLREKQRLKEEKERLKREAKEAKRLLKLAKLEAKKPKAKVEPKQQVVTPEVQQPQQPGKPATTTTSTVTTSTTIRGDPSTLNDDVGSELPVEPSRDGGRVLISKTSEVPIDENNEVERIVEEVVGDDGTVTKTTKIVETKYVTMRQEEIRVAEHRDIPTDEWDRIRAERSQSPQASISHASHLAQPQGHHCHAGTGVVETTRSKRHYIVREARDDRATRELDEIVATPSCFDVERVPEGVDLRASIKKQFAKRVKMNQKIIKRAQKLSWSEAKRAKRETLRAEHEIAICDCAAREARKELKRAVKEAKRAVKEAEKRHKKMDKIDKQIAKRQKKLEKRQRKIDKKMAKAAKKQAKRQAKSEKKAFKESLKRAGSSATSAKSIRLEDIGAPVLHSSSRHDLQRERSADSTGFVERHLIVTEETTRTNTSDGCGVCPYAPTAGAAAAAITEADVQQVPSVTRSAVITTIGQSVSPEVPMSLDDSTTLIQQQQQQQQADADQAKSLDDAANMHSELNASRDEADDDVIDVVGLDDDEQEHEGAPSSAHVITGNLSVAAEKANQERAERPPLTPVQSIKHEEPNVDCREEPRNVTSLQAHKLEALVHDPEGQEESQPNEEDLPQEKQPETDEASQVVSKNDPGLSFDPEEAQNKQTSQAVLGEESSEPPQPTEAPTDDEPEVLSLEAPKLEALIREPEAPEESHKPQEERPSIEATAEKVDVQAPQASASESPLDDSSDPLEDDRQQKQQEQQQADDASGEGQESQKKPAQKKRPRKKNKK